MSDKIKSFIVFVLALLLAWGMMVFFSGCSIDKQINYHNKQAARHVKKALNKGYKPVADTVYVLDSVFVPRVRLDTVLIEKQGDTITIEKERLKLRYVRVADSVFIEAECLPDTLVKLVPYSVQEKIYITQTKAEALGLDTWWKVALFWLVLILIAVIFLWRLIK